MNNYVNLSCPSCGGKLKITAKIDQFACMYCGNEFKVNRGEGIISLSPLLEHVKKIQEGVDKTASELAIVRLQKEIENLKNKEREIERIMSKYRFHSRSHTSNWEGVYMQYGIAHIITTVDHRQPPVLSKWWNGIGYTDDEIAARWYSVSIDELHILKNYFHGEKEKYPMNKKFPGIEVDVARIIDIRLSFLDIPEKEKEIEKHQKIVKA